MSGDTAARAMRGVSAENKGDGDSAVLNWQEYPEPKIIESISIMKIFRSESDSQLEKIVPQIETIAPTTIALVPQIETIVPTIIALESENITHVVQDCWLETEPVATSKLRHMFGIMQVKISALSHQHRLLIHF